MPLRLKSLELHGYKTFASRTLFVFADTVTAIVGPNGSGKSNIADSLRWVLGEQSYTLLRGKKTEDMIFAGSEHRSRAGMASATIVFDNSDGWLPIDFSEVAITRRAYRDGQNEYLINGQRVRLKDVAELLAQSGLAERTYTIIGQGLVDAALALKAEERRRLFEEAAGIALHRGRREEALRRLETTRRNLERVQDILAELLPRLRSLERQARRAQEYDQIKADLQVLLREWYGYQWHHAQRELADGREAGRAREAALEAARREQAALDEKLSGLRERLLSLRASLNSWHRQSAALHSRREAISRELAVADERLRSLHDQGQNSESELARLAEELGFNQEQVASARTEADRLQDEHKQARVQAEMARQALAGRQAERARVEKEVQSARQNLAGLNNRQGGLQARLAERHGQIERARKELDAAARALTSAEGERQAAEARCRTADGILREAEASRKQADEDLQSHRIRLSEAEARRRSDQEARTVAAADLARCKAELDVLEGAEKALTGYSGGTRALLQAARQDRLKGVVGALSSQLEVPFELESAILAALGEYLDAVLLHTETDSALDLLLKESARGALLPLKNLKPAEPLAAPPGGWEQGSGILGVGSDLVSAPPELRPAVDLVLGQTLIVQDRAAGRRAMSRLNGNGRLARVVTLKGEVFLSSGPVLSGGSSGESGAQSVLGRARRRRELALIRSEAEQKVFDLDARIRDYEGELKALQGEGDRLTNAQRTARQAEEKAVQAVQQARLAADQAARQVTWQKEQRERLLDEIRRGQVDLDKLSGDIRQIEAQIAEMRERLRELNSSLASLTTDEFQAQVMHWNTQSAVVERALVDVRSRLQERQAIVDRALRSQASLRARKDELAAALQNLEKEKTVQRQVEGEIGAEIEAVRALITPAEIDLDKLEKEQTELQGMDSAARQTLSLAEHNYAQVRITQARRQEALDSLRRRIEDDFGLVAFEYMEELSGPTPLPLQGMVEQLPKVTQLSPELEENIKRLRAQLRRMGAINPEAQVEYGEVRERYNFLTDQVADLQNAEVGVRQVINELDALMEREFLRTFDAVAIEFRTIFTRLFGGGSARLVLTDPDDLTDTGIEIEARLPGRRTQGLSLLSGGERSLTAAALVFALLKVSPTPFCVFDEVDAMLDEANVARFRDLLRELSQNTQFVVVTHNRNTVQAADIIYGVTMSRDTASQVVSLKLDEVSKIVE